MKGETRSERLGRWIDRLEICLAVAGALVVAGLILEDGPEIWQAVKTCTWPSRGVLGGLLVTLGVLAEVAIAFVIARIAKIIDRLSEDKVALANKRSAEALERVANAELATSEANLARAQLEQRTAELTAEIERLRKAARDLAVDQLPRSAIFTPMMPKFASILEGGPKTPVEILYPAEDAEARELGMNLWHCFQVAEWVVPMGLRKIPEYPHEPMSDIAIAGGKAQGITVLAGPASEGPLKTISAAFEAVLHECGGLQFKPYETMAIDLPESSVRIIVGPKL